MRSKWMTTLAVTVLAFSSTLSTPSASFAHTPSASQSAIRCTDLGASNLRWVTLSEDGTAGETVEAYPSETQLIYPIFDYECVPRKTTIVTVLSFDNAQVSTRKDTLKASDEPSYFGIYYSYDDEGEYFDDGEWSIEYFSNNELVASGSIMVGEDPTLQVTVVGKVTDASSKKSIKGAHVMVLTPGMTSEEFLDNDMPDEDILASALTTVNGSFVLDEPLIRNTEYSIVVTARGYKPTTYDEVSIDDETPDPLRWTITMEK